jgi:WD40 repeat protein
VRRALRNTLVGGIAAALVLGAAALSLERRLEPFAERVAAHGSNVHTIGWLDDGTLLSASVDGIHVWDVSNPFDRRWGPRVARSWEWRPRDAVVADSAAIAPGSGEVVMVDRFSGVPWLWSARDRSLGKVDGPVLGDHAVIALSHDGRIAAFGAGAVVEAWDLGRRERLWRRDLENFATAVAIDPDGSRVVVGAYDRVIVYDASGRRVREKAWGREAGGTGIPALAISPDGDRLALALRGFAVQSLRGPEAAWSFGGVMTAVAFSSSGKIIAAEEGQVGAFDPATLSPLATFPVEKARTVACQREGDGVAVGTEDGRVVFLDLTPTGFVAR